MQWACSVSMTTALLVATVVVRTEVASMGTWITAVVVLLVSRVNKSTKRRCAGTSMIAGPSIRVIGYMCNCDETFKSCWRGTNLCAWPRIVRLSLEHSSVEPAKMLFGDVGVVTCLL